MRARGVLAGRAAAFVAALLHAGCATPEPAASDAPAPRRGDEMVVCGRYVSTGTPIVLWSDPGGYDAYLPRRRFGAGETRPSRATPACDVPLRYDPRPTGRLSPAARAAVAARGWGVEELSAAVDRFVVHYDVCGTARRCFEILHDVRGLSVHFLLDVDGTLYQTLDLQERARHAGAANDRSVGVEIAHIGAYRDFGVLGRWYPRDESGARVLRLPADLRDDVRTPGFQGRPARAEPVRGTINGASYVQFDYTPEQYRALAALAASLSRTLPGIDLDAPRDPAGGVLDRALTPQELDAYSGVLGHWHVTDAKQDPGPAFDWERFLAEARALR